MVYFIQAQDQMNQFLQMRIHPDVSHAGEFKPDVNLYNAVATNSV